MLPGYAYFVAAFLVMSCAPERPVEPGFGAGAALLWKAPGVAVGRVSVDSSLAFFPGFYNELIAVRKSTGQVAWREPTNNLGRTIGLGTAVSGPVVVMLDLYLYAFDRVNGRPRWIFRGETGASPANSNPAANDSLVFEGSGGGITWALRATTGEVVWRRPSPVDYPALAREPVPSGNRVFVCYVQSSGGFGGALAALDATTGAVLWVHDFTQYVTGYQDAGCHGNAVADATTVYTSLGRGDVLALDRASGALRWRNGDENALAGITFRPLALSRGVLVAGSSDGHLEGLVPQTGKLLWTHDLKSGSITDPIAYDATTVYVAPSGQVAAINPLDGEVLWSDGLGGRSQLSFEVFGPGAVDDRAFYIGGGGGLYAFRK